MHVSVRDGLLDLHADGVSLGDVLRAVAREAGFSIEIQSDLTSPVTSWRMENVPVVKALFRLAGSTSFVLQAPEPLPGEATARGQLRIYGDGSSSAAGSDPTKSRKTQSTGVARSAHSTPSVTEAERSGRSPHGPPAGSGEKLAELHAVMTGAEDPGLRLRALDTIATLDDEHALQAMADALGDKDDGVREHLIFLLGERSEETATTALAQAYFVERNASMRLKILESLARQRTPAAMAILAAAIEDKSRDVRAAAQAILRN